uniref:Uncharacterized protein LOC104239024 n=1 Tax=Nicotiana sylvestris TaxID=4096 RepID=A0A1U7XQG5_NICSY|nr:PREDICTED: uncharacterized protein LOC104239024 [Nicotiana sylvestris]
MELSVCYGCGMRGHIQRHCHMSLQGAGRGTTQPASPAAATSLAPCPSREASPDVVTSILTVQSNDMYALIDLGSTLSYVTPFVVMEFGKEPEQLHELFLVSTPVGESILAVRVYKSCVVTVCGRDTRVDLIELGMVDFDKAVKFQWSDACEKSFQELKSRLTTALVLTLPEGIEGFVVYCDASRIGLGCALMQHDKVDKAQIQRKLWRNFRQLRELAEFGD